jgi:hypothetical protein
MKKTARTLILNMLFLGIATGGLSCHDKSQDEILGGVDNGSTPPGAGSNKQPPVAGDPSVDLNTPPAPRAEYQPPAGLDVLPAPLPVPVVPPDPLKQAPSITNGALRNRPARK